MHILDELEARGLLKDVTHVDALRERMDEGPITFYTGYDPTSDSLTLGNCVPLMLQAHLQRAGHKPIVVMGGATGLVGDPTGKDTTRTALTREQLAANLAGQRPVYGRVLELADSSDAPHAAVIVDNASWFAGIGYLEFLRDVGRFFSVNEMITADTYARRLANQQHLSFIEFNYRCLQAYDFLHLFREHGCELQVGGSDQWGNCVAGTELIRKAIPGARAWVLTCPLLLTADGRKMGKTESGAVFVGAHKTPPYDLYQYFVNVADTEVGKLLRIFTFLPLDEIAELEAKTGAAINETKQRLAWEVTALFHGADEADKARDAAAALFGDGGAVDDVPTVELSRADVLGDGGMAIYKLFVEAGLQASGKAAKTLAKQGGAYLNDERVADPFAKIGEADLSDGALLLRAGKKKYCRVVLV